MAPVLGRSAGHILGGAYLCPVTPQDDRFTVHGAPEWPSPDVLGVYEREPGIAQGEPARMKA
ncbi:hypothetical protein MDUV_19110 [Mycolicibacterium duvalii]|uniref:Uncharacterized protein n=1 Tax=Mycolicibacterium duvalii TaxID=39688 RepID=A0A7I7K0M6_9MYCO|nr:hypothetical protein MDUV_19110 [Mycolicibacterium duvalii]